MSCTGYEPTKKGGGPLLDPPPGARERKGGLRVYEQPIRFDYEQPIELPQFKHL